MTTVYWNVLDKVSGNSYDWLNLTHYEPESVLSYLIKERGTSSHRHYMKCPALLDYLRNVYVVRSPIDITLRYDKETDYLTVTPQSQDFFDTFITPRGAQAGEKDPFLVSLSLFYLFIADKECTIEQLPVMFHDKTVASKINIIPGMFDISKWYRPVELAFEIIDSSIPLTIKRGDPLYYVRFVTPNNKKISLVKHEFDVDVIKATKNCIAIKTGYPKQPLSVLYKLAERISLKFKKKCPFNWRNK